MAKSPEEMAASMIANLPEKTGRSLDEWLALTRSSGLEKHGQLVKHLKSEHGVTHGYANLIAHETLKAESGGAPSDDELVAAQYAGAKADLRPIYEALLEAVGDFGDDVEIAPKKTYVSLRGGKQFGIIKASTQTRVDVGIGLGDAEPAGRLQPGKTFGGMCSHQVGVSSVDEVDDELVGWLREAYEQSA